MLSYNIKLDDLIERLKRNLQCLLATKEVPLSQVKPPKSPGVYMLFFEEKLQYIGSSGNLNERIRANLLGGNRESHTLINKLCKLRKWSVPKVLSFLKFHAHIKFIETETEDDARILEDALISIFHPLYNTPLKKLKLTEKAKVTHTRQKGLDVEQVYQALVEHWQKTKTAAYSRQISDLLGIEDSDYGRGMVRATMKKLAEQKRVKITVNQNGKIKYYYEPIIA
jgi:hypothetical protein